MKDIKEYLPHYMGCNCFVQGQIERHPIKLTGISYDDQLGETWCYFENTETSYALIQDVQPLLRQLPDMTEEYFLSLFKMSIGCFEDMNVSEFKRWSSSDLYVRLGYGQFIFGYAKHPKPDVRVEEGISFFIKEYLIEDRLELTDKGLTKTQSHFNKENLAIAFNQSVIFNKLRKDSFDVDGLIESNLAIDSTKLPTQQNKKA